MSTNGVRLTLTQFPHNQWYEDSRSVYVFIGDVAEMPVAHVEASEHVVQSLKGGAGQIQLETLNILHMNDLHGRLAIFGDDYSIKTPFATLVSYIENKRSEDRTDATKGMLLFSGGDEIAGSPFEQLWIETGIHAVYQSYNHIGLSAAVLGNHEFDLGPDALARAITMYARFPILSANLIAEGELATCVFPAAIFNVDGLNVGVIGVTTSEYTKNSGHYRLTDPIQAIQNILPIVDEWSDLVIILSHTGHSETGDLALSNQLPGSSVDLIIGAHTHHAIAMSSDSTIPIVQAGCHAEFLGETVFHWDRMKRSGRFVQSQLLATADIKENPTPATDFLIPFIDITQEMLLRPIGPESLPTVGYGNDEVEAEFDRGMLHLPSLLADAIFEGVRQTEREVDFAIVDHSVVQAGFQHLGQPLMGDWMRVIPFVDEIRVAVLTGQEVLDLIKDNLERIALLDSSHDDRDQSRGVCYFSQALDIDLLGRSEDGDPILNGVRLNGISLFEQLNHTFHIAYPAYFRQLAAEWEKKQGRPLFDLTKLQSETTNLLVRETVLAYINELEAYPESDSSHTAPYTVTA